MMKQLFKSAFVLLLLVLGLFTLGAAGNGDTGRSPAEASAAEESGDFVTVVDSLGRTVRVALPVESLVTMNSGLSEVVAALGAADLAVGRCSYSTFPSSMRRVPVVGRNSSSPSMEMIVALEPDLLIADAMFDEGKIETLEKQGTAVIIESTSNPERLPVLVNNLGRVLQKEEKAGELLEFVNETLNRVKESVAALNAQGVPQPPIFFENRKANKSASALSGHDIFISSAGGRNIAADEPVKYPLLSPEFIAVENPEVIIRRVSGDIDEEAMEAMRQTILDRPSLENVRAVLDDRVYVVKSDLFISLRYPVGVAYFADLFYPGLLDFDPDEIHRSFVETVYGRDEWERVRETYVHPSR